MIAVTGASGLLGANLVRELLRQGSRVRALVHRDERALAGLDIETARADLAEPASLERAFEGVDTVYHLASLISISMGNWEDVERVNVTGTRRVVEACLCTGVRRLVYAGSVHARRPEPLDQPLDEERPMVTDDSLPPYDRSKALGELEAQKGLERGLDVIVILPSAILGPCDFGPSYVGQALKVMREGRLPALVSGGYDWVDARDVAAGAICAAQGAPPGSRYILSGHWLSVHDVAHMAAEMSGTRAPRVVVPLWLAELFAPVMERLAVLNGGGQPLYTRAMLSALHSNKHISHARASRELGYHPRPFEQTLADTLSWFSANRGH
jgi:dihydroflavonol-4-reductase